MKVLREIVNGALLGNFIGKKVSIMGFVTDINNTNATSFEIRSVDNMTITIKVSTPLDDMIEGYVEVHGTCQSAKVINADEYIQFSPSQINEFDVEGHNNVCKLLQQVPDVYKVY